MGARPERWRGLRPRTYTAPPSFLTADLAAQPAGPPRTLDIILSALPKDGAEKNIKVLRYLYNMSMPFPRRQFGSVRSCYLGIEAEE